VKVLHAASEVAGFAKTGGLADVVGSLPVALAKRGVECAVVMPLYAACRRSAQSLDATEHRFRLPMGDQIVEGRVWRSSLPNSSVPVYLIEQPEYYERDDPKLGRSYYQYAGDGGVLTDYADNAARFGFFSRGLLEVMRLVDFWPDVLHLHDWQTGLAGVYLRETYRPHGKRDLRDRYGNVRTMFTIHNLAYQGTFWELDLPLLDLPRRLFTAERLEFYGKINFLKAGIVEADTITTVSPTYAREIQTTLLGCGLHGVLMERSRRLHGIVNGIDDRVWDPAHDPHIAANYDSRSLAGKAKCKLALQQHFKLDETPRTPLIGIVSRLAAQKGFDLIEKALPDFLHQGAQLAVLGDGEKPYRDMLVKLRGEFPRQVGVHLGYDEALAHRIEAGADMYLMPSRYEPCGLNQLYSLRYGTVPIVRATGGLADTVVDAKPETLAMGRATGFSFGPYAPFALTEALQRAIATYRDEPAKWQILQQTGMVQDWSWRRSAAEYERLYYQLNQQV
jgi:starch synthase